MLAKIKYTINNQEVEETILPDVKSEYLFSSGLDSIMQYLTKKYSWEVEKIEAFQMEWVTNK